MFVTLVRSSSRLTKYNVRRKTVDVFISSRRTDFRMPRLFAVSLFLLLEKILNQQLFWLFLCTCYPTNLCETTVKATSMKTAAFWDVAPCSTVEIHRRFRSTCCFHYRADSPWFFFFVFLSIRCQGQGSRWLWQIYRPFHVHWFQLFQPTRFVCCGVNTLFYCSFLVQEVVQNRKNCI
jgi:hypothetical protein